jgi:hypothetical protein
VPDSEPPARVASDEDIERLYELLDEESCEDWIRVESVVVRGLLRRLEIVQSELRFTVHPDRHAERIAEGMLRHGEKKNNGRGTSPPSRRPHCSVKGCTRFALPSGMCRAHQLAARKGDLSKVSPRARKLMAKPKVEKPITHTARLLNP